MNIIFIAVSLFFYPAFLHAMQLGENVYPALPDLQNGSLQESGSGDAVQDFRVVVEPASSESTMPKWRPANCCFTRYLTKKNQQLLTTHDFQDVNNATYALKSRRDEAYENLVSAWRLLKNREGVRKDAAADSAGAQKGMDAKIEQAFMKAVLLELGAQQAQKCAALDEDMKPRRRRRCTGFALSAGIAAQLAWWGLYVAATTDKLSCYCFPWKTDPDNLYLPPYCQ